MLYQRFWNPKVTFVMPVLLALALTIACGGAAPPPPKAAAPEAPKAPVAAAPAAPAAPKLAATPVPAAKSTPAPAATLTEKRLHLAVTPLPQDSYIPRFVTSSGHLPFRPFMENLTTIDPQKGQSTILPQLATEWQISPDAKSYTFKLRKGVPFHFGKGEFTVKDFINSLDQAITDDSITGCTGPMRATLGAKSATEMIQKGSLKVVDDYTFTMDLPKPQVDLHSWWFNIMQATCVPIYSSAQFKAEGDAMFDKKPAATGPYQFARRQLKEFTEYERVPYNHWRVNPEFKTLRITTAPEEATRLAMLLTKEADMVDIAKVLHDQATAAGMVVLESAIPDVNLTIMMFGQYYVSKVNYTPEKDPWAEPGEKGRLVREALNRVVNREQILNVLFKGRGEPAYVTAFHSSLEGWNPEWKNKFQEKYGYDPEKAKKLLDQAGYPGVSGKNRFKAEVWMTSLPGLPETIEVAQSVAQDFRNIGIDAKIVETEFARALDAFRDLHDAHFILPLRVTMRPIMQNMRIYYYTGPTDPKLGRPTRGALYQEDPLFDEVYEKLLQTTDPKEVHRLARLAGDKNYNEYRTIPVIWLPATVVVNPKVVAEYNFGGVTGIFTHLEYAKPVK
jgi:ABC-type transport system substrate-binding protein